MNSELNPCLFIKTVSLQFVIIAVYVDDLNIIGTTSTVQNAVRELSKEFEMKDLGKTSYCLGLEVFYMSDGLLLHQSGYTRKLLKRFNMEDATPLQVRSLEPNKDIYRPKEENELPLDTNCPYAHAIGTLLYLANSTRPDIAFAVSLLARHTHNPTIRHWQGVKHVLRYLKGTSDIGLFFPNKGDKDLVGYADAGYLSDPSSGRSQTGHVFLYGGTSLSWRSVKQMLVATSSNHAEILALYEGAKEAVFLRSVVNHIRTATGQDVLRTTNEPTVLYEDNAACIYQIEQGFIKSERTKHIMPKFFYATEVNHREIEVTKVASSENVADIFTKTLPTVRHWEILPKLGLRSLHELKGERTL